MRHSGVDGAPAMGARVRAEVLQDGIDGRGVGAQRGYDTRAGARGARRAINHQSGPREGRSLFGCDYGPAAARRDACVAIARAWLDVPHECGESVDPRLLCVFWRRTLQRRRSGRVGRLATR